MTSTSPPEKASTQRTTRNQYPQRVQAPTTTRYHHGTQTQVCHHQGIPQPIKPQPYPTRTTQHKNYLSVSQSWT
ncbi:hypothetical protein Taro_041294 [Colocasia esculenta]|uniref:Uncharacterized protein n=1 Tax=Colocasia esculenta TaxID=4460 RepID=A0A843WL39_COLES|nr:hypothetical protein [Colocasia esculenta]